MGCRGQDIQKLYRERAARLDLGRFFSKLGNLKVLSLDGRFDACSP
jgi:hypothetical protein